jgi:solute:Na+ symporter, SSS family
MDETKGLTMLGNWDYLVIGLYLLFTMSIGWVCRKVAHNSSDFFRGGGNMLWWMTGMSGLASGLSAWTFTAAATRVYDMGFFMIYLYWLWVPAYLIIFFYLAQRYRQMRIITVADGIKRRYGRFTEQFWIWVQIPANMMIGAMWLMTVSIFMSAAVGVPLNWCILILGIVVTCVSLGAGAWSVIASDFVQMTIIIVGATTVLIRAITLPEVGGVDGFMEQIPEGFTNFSVVESPSIWIAFLLLSMIMRIMQASDLSQEGAKFLSVKDGREAKKSAAMLTLGYLLVPIIAFVPVMICSFIYPDLSDIFPKMENPTEGAYMAIAAHVLPTGMVGLIVCAMFAASISSMDTALNRNAGFCVKNFYKEFVRPDADEKEQLLMGRVFTVILAIVLITLATTLANNREIGLFEFSNLVFSLVIPPMVVPAVFGFVYKKTPVWTGWSTVIVGFSAAFLTKTFVSIDAAGKYIFGFGDQPMNALESGDVTFMVITAVTLLCSISWFFFTSLFYKRVTPEHKESIDALFKDMRTPIDHVAEHSENNDATQYHIVGSLNLILGGLLMVGCLIPNSLSERMVFIYCGGVVAGIGGILLAIYHKKMKSAE